MFCLNWGQPEVAIWRTVVACVFNHLIILFFTKLFKVSSLFLFLQIKLPWLTFQKYFIPLCPHITLFSLLFLAANVSQLTPLIFSFPSTALRLLNKVPKTRADPFTPPFLLKMCPLHHSQRSHMGHFDIDASEIGSRSWEERNLRQAWKWSIPTVLTLLVDKSLHNIGKSMWKAAQSSLLHPFPFLCSKTDLFSGAWHCYSSWNSN